jgi:phage gpG-like protein
MPSGFKSTIDFKAGDQALRLAQRVRALGEDDTPLLQIMRDQLVKSVDRRFIEERGPGGVPWPKSKPARGLVPRANGKKRAGRTLFDTGDLQDSIKAVIRPGEVEIGSDGLRNPVKAIANQYGSSRQAVVLAHTRTINQAFGVPLPSPIEVQVRAHGMVTNLPARPFIGFDEDDKRGILTAFRQHILGILLK